MRHLAGLILALTILPATLHAGDGPTPFVQVPCYPENRLEICGIPAMDGHPYGYVPYTVPSTIRLAAGGRRFAILVTPNVVPYDLAVADAARAAAAHCGLGAGERIVARIDEQERYAPEDPASWRFGGICE